MELKKFYDSCVRVLKRTKKPTPQEFKDLVKITGLGLMVIGAIGFLIQVIKELIVS